MKAALAEQVAPQMVYRLKSGFVPPIEKKCQHPAFAAAFDRLCEQDSVLRPFIVPGFFRKLWPSIRAGVKLPVQTSNVLWTAVFLNEWMEQVRSNRRLGTPSATPGRL